MNIVSRQEHKYLITAQEYIRHSHYLSQLLSQDEHNGTHGYIIRSLYFDTLGNRDFTSKEDGTEVRRKIRLRLYDPSASFAMLEMKQKQGAEQLKRSLRLSRDDTISLIKGNYSCLLKQSEPFAFECYTIMNEQCYRPTAVIEYKRKAFIAKENKIRVTFDSNIEATESCFDIFSPNLCLYPVLDKYLVILEIKYNGFLLNYIKDIANEYSKSSLSVSKYCLGRQVSLQYIY